MEAEQERNIIVVKETELCTISVDMTLSIIKAYCKQHMEGEEMRQNLLALLDLIHVFKPKFILGNVRALHYLDLQDSNWFWQKIVMSLRGSSVVKWARIEDPHSMVELSTMQIRLRLEEEGIAKSELQFDAFPDEESALHWLLQE